MVYRLDAVDAYERKLVKQIEVASATEDAHNKPYVRLLEVATSAAASGQGRAGWQTATVQGQR
jgi:restriction endonuclease